LICSHLKSHNSIQVLPAQTSKVEILRADDPRLRAILDKRESSRVPSSNQEASKSFASLFPSQAVSNQENPSPDTNHPIQHDLLRNLDSTSKKMLFDPKKGVLVETPIGQLLKSDKSTLKTTEKKKHESSAVKEEIILWKRNSNEDTLIANKKTEDVSSSQKDTPLQDTAVVSPAQRRLEEKRTRAPRTKGVLYEFTESGDLLQVLTAEEILERENCLMIELAARTKREHEQSLLEKKEQKRDERKSNTSGEGVVAIQKLPSSQPVVTSSPQHKKPAWQAPHKTLADLGMPSSAPSLHSEKEETPTLSDNNNKIQEKISNKKAKQVEKKAKLLAGRKAKKLEETRKKSHPELPPSTATSTSMPLPPSPSHPLDIDTTNLDIRNQGPLLRNPSSYATFIPGAGLSSQQSNSTWGKPYSSPLEYDSLELAIESYNLPGLDGADDPRLAESSAWYFKHFHSLSFLIIDLLLGIRLGQHHSWRWMMIVTILTPETMPHSHLWRMLLR
jgi:hypothetical protein